MAGRLAPYLLGLEDEMNDTVGAKDDDSWVGLSWERGDLSLPDAVALPVAGVDAWTEHAENAVSTGHGG